MAETSGFFQAQWDDSLIDPTTGQSTGYWDRNYIAKQFADYFALFIGNGVFGSPTNQLKVIPGTGLSVIITPGWAFINGCWYHNDENKEIALTSNALSSNRTDGVMVRLSNSDRTITSIVTTGSSTTTRGATVYDLKIADVIVRPNAVTISASDIVDTRTNEAVCGLVKGLMEVETTADLFAQYNSQFNEWFDSIKDQLTGDLAVRIQLEFEQLNQAVEDYYDNTQDAIEDYEQNISDQISGYNTTYQQTLGAAQQAATTAQSLVSDYVDKDYVIAEQAFTFVNKVCTINDSKVTANSLIDVYFTAETISEAAKAGIVVDSAAGSIIMTANKQPTNTIRGMIRVRVRS